MCASILGFQAPLLRGIADQLQLRPVSEIARQPGAGEVYRITVHYFDGRACNSVATLRGSSSGTVTLEIVYQRALLHKPLSRSIDDERYADFARAIKSISFDRMGDQPELPAYNVTDLWLIERAAGTFSHSVILAPEQACDSYSRLANAVKNGLSEVLRQIKVGE